MKKIVLGIIAIVACISLVGCGKSEEKAPSNEANNVKTNENTVVTKNTENNEETKDVTPEEVIDILPEEELKDIQESVQAVELSSDDKKYVIKYPDDNSTAVFYYEGDSITGYQIYVDYDTPELASLAKEEYENSTEAQDEEIDTVEVQGNRLVVTYKESAYAEMSLDEVKQAFAMIQAIQGAKTEE